MDRKVAIMWLGCLFIGVVSVVGANAWLLRNSQVNQTSYDNIELGMLRGDVEAILGGPGVDCVDEKRSGPARKALEMQEDGTWEYKPDDNEPRRRRVWADGDGVIAVRFDLNERVTDRMFIKLEPISLSDRVWFFLGL